MVKHVILHNQDGDDLYPKTAQEQVDGLDTALDAKQNKLTAGSNITINGNIISATVPSQFTTITETADTTTISRGNASISVGQYMGAADPQIFVSAGANNHFFYKGNEVAGIDDSHIETRSTWSSQKIADELNDIEMSKFPNVTIYGQPTINQGQISNFNATNYAQFPFVVDFQGQPFELECEFTTGDDVTSQHNIFDSLFGLAFAVRNSRFVMAVSTNGTSWNEGEIIGGNPVTPNTTYRVRITWDQTELTLSSSTDGGSHYGDEFTMELDSQPYPKQIFIGITSDKRTFFNGIINLNHAKLTIANKVVWQGMDDVGLATRMAVNMSNIDEAGINRVKDIIEEVGSDSRFHIKYGERRNLVPRTVLNFTRNETLGCYVSQDNPFGDTLLGSDDFEINSLYKINFDGTEHDELSYYINQAVTSGIYRVSIIGNSSPLHLTNRYITDANFGIVYGYDYVAKTKVYVYGDFDLSTEHSISIDTIPMTITDELKKLEFHMGYSAMASLPIAKSTGEQSMILNNAQEATGKGATAMGGGTVASGLYSLATGQATFAVGNYSFTLGNRNTGNGNRTIAGGYLSNANGNISLAFGQETQTNASMAVALNNGTKANGSRSVATGNLTTAGYNSQFVMGYSNNNKEDSILEVGNGLKADGTPNSGGSVVSPTPQNAFRVTTDGKALAQTAIGVEKNDGTQIVLDADKLQELVESESIALKSPNGSKWKLTVDDDGLLITTKMEVQLDGRY